MTDLVKICVVTINYRNAGDTARCVASLQASTVPVGVVVVDNSPFDPELTQVLEGRDDITLVRPGKNLGFGQGNNLGVQAAFKKGVYDYVFLLNSDATVAPDTVERLLAGTKAHPEFSIFSPKVVLMYDPDVLWYGGGEVDWFRVSARVPGWLQSADSAIARTSREISFATGCAMLIKSDVWRTLGGFDPRFFMYEEDLELCLRARKAGLRIGYEASAVVQHIGQGSIRRRGEKFRGRLDPRNANVAFLAYHTFRNRVLNLRLHATGASFFVSLVGLMMLVVEKSVLFVRYGKFHVVRNVFSGIWSGLGA